MGKYKLFPLSCTVMYVDEKKDHQEPQKEFRTSVKFARNSELGMSNVLMPIYLVES